MTDEGAITNDIGIVIGKTAELSNHDKLNLISNAFVPGNPFRVALSKQDKQRKVGKNVH